MTECLAGNAPTAEQLQEWIEFFHTNGFLVIRNVLTPEQCELLRNDLDRDIIQEVGHKKAVDSRRIMKRMFEHSQPNLNLFDLEPIVIQM
ncbi:hypothetical protein [Aerosakkonema sp. BLCC-F183]